jgi:hypothetical protein
MTMLMLCLHDLSFSLPSSFPVNRREFQILFFASSTNTKTKADIYRRARVSAIAELQ